LQCSKYPFQKGKGKGKDISIFLLLCLIPRPKQAAYGDTYLNFTFLIEKGLSTYKKEKDNNISLSSFYFPAQERAVYRVKERTTLFPIYKKWKETRSLHFTTCLHFHFYGTKLPTGIR
jgi:hypothetical protein